MIGSLQAVGSSINIVNHAFGDNVTCGSLGSSSQSGSGKAAACFNSKNNVSLHYSRGA